MNKKLISINLAIILIITLFANVVFATLGDDGTAVLGGVSRPNADGTMVAPYVVDYIKIDGVIYEIGEEASGDGWRLDEYGGLILSGYVGGSIYANYDLGIYTLPDENRTPNTTISADTDEYGIYVDGDLYINNYSDNMVINGSVNKQAIYVNGDLHLTYNIIAVSSGCQALYANSVTIDSYAMIYGGGNENNLTSGKYIGEKYIKTVPIKYGFEHDVILDGNGILTTDGKEQHKIHLTVTTPTSLKLNTYKPKFNNKGQKLLGWVNENNEFVDNDVLEIKPYKDTETVYAYWENGINKVLILQNYFGNKAFKKPVKVGDKFTLPSISKEGYVFEGWYSDGILYNAGTEITVKDTCYFWPQFTNDNDDHEKQKWLTIGNTGMSVSGDITYDPQWKYYDDVDGGTLVLYGYDGGSIEANFNLNIELRYDAPSKIVAEYSGYGICVDGDLSFSTYVNLDGSKQGELEIQSQKGFEAIYATGNLELCPGITATGNDCSAIKAKEISIPDDTTVFVGNNKNDAVISEYISQQYVNIARKHYDFTVTLDANGGAKENGETKHVVKLYKSTPATLKLYDYDNLYKNGDKHLIGWKTSNDSFCKYNKYRFEAYDFDETLYAVWEDDVTKAVYLNNYYMDYNFEEHAEMSGGTVVETVVSGNFFELPLLARMGYVFDGWLMPDGTLKKAGEKIQINETTTLTAKYSINPDVIIINGREYPSNKRSGSYSSGWRFYPDAECAELEILHNYSGKPIVIPQNVNIHLEHDIKGDKELPALTVYGNANITTDYMVQISGQNGNPAIKVTGNLSFGEVASYVGLTYIIDTKPNNTPAINANKLTIQSNLDLLQVGTDLNSLEIKENYNNETALVIKKMYGDWVKLSKDSVVPKARDNDINNSENNRFIGWRTIYPQSKYNNWYMPGDIVDSDKDIIVSPDYLHESRTTIAIALNGNGGVTSNNSKYIVTCASASNLMPYDIPYEQFYREGYTFTGFNTDAAGNGTPYLYNSIIDDGHSYVYNLYAQWKKNETPATPSNPCITTVSTDRKTFTITPINVPIGKTIILALYNDKMFVEMQKAICDGTTVTFTTDKVYTDAKVMFWDGFTNLRPVCESEKILIVQ